MDQTRNGLNFLHLGRAPQNDRPGPLLGTPGRAWRGVAVLLIMTISGCAELSYYQQAISGHWRLLDERRNIAEVLADSATKAPLRSRLSLAAELRQFATETLYLPDNDSYRSYVDIGRRSVVFNVFAAPKLSLVPKTWCFPMLGCVAYRGYFSEQQALWLAGELGAQDYDVYVGGVPAYSTLGWFADPLLSTFVDWPESRLGELMFHELAHQQLYIANDTSFNESFATAVGQLGVELWLGHDPQAMQRYRADRHIQQDFVRLVSAAKSALEQMYNSTLTQPQKTAEKVRLFALLQRDFVASKANRWNDYEGYDKWFASVNNAKLAAFASYSEYVPAFLALFSHLGGDLRAFYQASAQIGKLPFDGRRAALKRWQSVGRRLSAADAS